MQFFKQIEAYFQIYDGVAGRYIADFFSVDTIKSFYFTKFFSLQERMIEIKINIYLELNKRTTFSLPTFHCRPWIAENRFIAVNIYSK